LVNKRRLDSGHVLYYIKYTANNSILESLLSYNTRLYIALDAAAIPYSKQHERDQLRDWVIVASITASHALGILALLRKLNCVIITGRHHGVDWGGQVNPTFAWGCSWDWCKSDEFWCGVGEEVGHVWISTRQFAKYGEWGKFAASIGSGI